MKVYSGNHLEVGECFVSLSNSPVFVPDRFINNSRIRDRTNKQNTSIYEVF